ncbi:MAG TPA: hypothetical protein VJ183_05945 [Chloroflexia bacterium]|nr:hypothetical protein [Chloroflexia bacterium]
MFLGWFDDTPKKSVSQKLAEAIERYEEKFGVSPSLCLVNANNVTTYDGLEVRVADYVRPNHFWVGRGDWPVEEVQAA